jgi:hypothetical protein
VARRRQPSRAKAQADWWQSRLQGFGSQRNKALRLASTWQRQPAVLGTHRAAFLRSVCAGVSGTACCRQGCRQGYGS